MQPSVTAAGGRAVPKVLGWVREREREREREWGTGAGAGAGVGTGAGNGNGQRLRDEIPDRTSKRRRDECRTGRATLDERRRLPEKTEETEETATRFIDRIEIYKVR